MREFLAMDGYAAYIWPAYIVSFVALAALGAAIVLRARRAGRNLKAAEEARAKSGDAEGDA